MSLCQSKKDFSCGACCGLFNLDLETKEYKSILEERTNQFATNVNYDISWTIAEFRKSRESIESKFNKKDETIYNCPYLGYIDEYQKKIGCMIHPNRTGNPKSQNFSFYGTSICQGYSCKNIERSSSTSWKEIFEKLELSSIEYSRLASDHITIDRIENFFQSLEINLFDSNYFHLIKKLLLHILTLEKSKNLTSFEIDMETDKGNKFFELLVLRLELKGEEEIYFELEEIKNRGVEKTPG